MGSSLRPGAPAARCRPCRRATGSRIARTPQHGHPAARAWRCTPSGRRRPAGCAGRPARARPPRHGRRKATPTTPMGAMQRVEQAADGMPCLRDLLHQRMRPCCRYLVALGLDEQQQGIDRPTQVMAGSGQEFRSAAVGFFGARGLFAIVVRERLVLGAQFDGAVQRALRGAGNRHRHHHDEQVVGTAQRRQEQARTAPGQPAHHLQDPALQQPAAQGIRARPGCQRLRLELTATCRPARRRRDPRQLCQWPDRAHLCGKHGRRPACRRPDPVLHDHLCEDTGLCQQDPDRPGQEHGRHRALPGLPVCRPRFHVRGGVQQRRAARDLWVRCQPLLRAIGPVWRRGGNNLHPAQHSCPGGSGLVLQGAGR